MNLQEKILLYRSLYEKIREMEREKRALGAEILSEMPEKKVMLEDCKAVRYERLSIKTSIEQARLFDATKMEERLDLARIKELYRLGAPIEGVEAHSYLVVSGLKTAPEEIESI